MVKRLLVLGFVSCLFGGCVSPYTRTVYVPHGQSVRLRERVKKVKIWAKTETGEMVPGKIDLPEGWYCLPLDKKE